MPQQAAIRKNAQWDLPIEQGDIIIVKAETVNPGLSIFERAFWCSGHGFGTKPYTAGTAVYGEWLDGTGKSRIERHEISAVETLAFRAAIEKANVIIKFLAEKDTNAREDCTV